MNEMIFAIYFSQYKKSEYSSNWLLIDWWLIDNWFIISYYFMSNLHWTEEFWEILLFISKNFWNSIKTAESVCFFWISI